jgi:hypothetical protein
MSTTTSEPRVRSSARHRDISLRTINLAAKNAECDQSVAFKVAIGLPVSPAVRERVAAELRRLGVEVPVLVTADQLLTSRPTAPGAVGGRS